MIHCSTHFCRTGIYSLAFLLYPTDPPNRWFATGSREPCGDGGWSSQGVEAFDVTWMPKKPDKRLEMYSWHLYFLLVLLDLVNCDIHAVRWIKQYMIRYDKIWYNLIHVKNLDVWFTWCTSIAWNYKYWDKHTSVPMGHCNNVSLLFMWRCTGNIHRHDTAKPDQLGRFIPLFTGGFLEASTRCWLSGLCKKAPGDRRSRHVSVWTEVDGKLAMKTAILLLYPIIHSRNILQIIDAILMYCYANYKQLTIDLSRCCSCASIYIYMYMNIIYMFGLLRVSWLFTIENMLHINFCAVDIMALQKASILTCPFSHFSARHVSTTLPICIEWCFSKNIRYIYSHWEKYWRKARIVSFFWVTVRTLILRN